MPFNARLHRNGYYPGRRCLLSGIIAKNCHGDASSDVRIHNR